MGVETGDVVEGDIVDTGLLAGVTLVVSSLDSWHSHHLIRGHAKPSHQ